MDVLTPFPVSGAVQEGANEGGEAALSGAEQPVRTPLIQDADAAALWVGFGAFIVIFLLVIVLVIRNRVIKPARRIAQQESFFEPAGADAEITFEEPTAAEEAEKSRRKRRREERRKKNRAEIEIQGDIGELDDVSAAPAPALASPPAPEAAETDPTPAPEPAETTPAALDAVEPARAPRKAQFANLFHRHPETDPQTGDGANDDASLQDVEQAVIDERMVGSPPPREPTGSQSTAPPFWLAETPGFDDAANEARQREELEKAEEARRAIEQEADRIRADAAAAQRAVAVAVEREDLERKAALDRRKAEAALEQRMQSLATLQRKLNEQAETLTRDAQAVEHRLNTTVGERLETLAQDLNDKLDAATGELARLSATLRPGAASAGEGATALAREISQLKRSVEGALSRLSERVDELAAANAGLAGGREDLRRLNRLLAERAAPAVAGVLQLHDLIHSVLPADRYAFDYVLSNGATADCLIKPAGEAKPYAIDARFPVDAFEKYLKAEETDRPQAETIYRRAVLRHLIFVAEKLIAVDETADFAVLLVPSDTIFNDLHRQFSDVVQDSYRARIWIASPTSLMAMLHMMNAATARYAGNAREASANGSLRDDIAALADRIERLEGGQSPVAEPPAPFPDPAYGGVDLFSDVDEGEDDAGARPSSSAEEHGDDEDSGPATSPFPLR